MTTLSKICEVCLESYHPDSRVGDRQRVCKKLSCQQERKRRSQQRWVSNNPDYFKDRYDELKVWLASHPGYLKAYRHRKKLQAQLVSCDIQDEITFYELRSKQPLLQRLRDIQDELTTYFTKQIWFLEHRFPLIYKTS